MTRSHPGTNAAVPAPPTPPAAQPAPAPGTAFEATFRHLTVAGAVEFTPKVFHDQRGLFVNPYQEPVFVRAVGHPFPMVQTCQSVSRRGVVRGVHFTVSPPGQAKYVYCARGRVLDFVVDLRTGSPTFGQWDSVFLDQEQSRAVYLPVGVGHAFIAVEEEAVMVYMVSSSYVPQNELAVSPLDPDLALPLSHHIDHEPILSERDRQAPTLQEALERGLLPKYRTARTPEEAP